MPIRRKDILKEPIKREDFIWEPTEKRRIAADPIRREIIREPIGSIVYLGANKVRGVNLGANQE